MQSAYDKFMKTQPELQAFEAELKKYMAIETEVANISAIHNIGECVNSMQHTPSCAAPVTEHCEVEADVEALSRTPLGRTHVDGCCADATLPTAGSLSLETVPLKNALKSEAASWKARFAQNLHGQCAGDLKAFDAYIR
jgi:dynein heavy chain